MKTLQRCRGQRILQGFRDKNLRRASILIRTTELTVVEIAETKQRSRPLEPWKFSQGRTKAQKAQEEQPSSDLGQILDSCRIYGSCTRFSHRDIDHREIRILELVRIGTSIAVKSRRRSRPSIGRGHMAEIKCHQRFGASRNRHSHGKEIGEVHIRNSDKIRVIRPHGTGVRDLARAEKVRKSEFSVSREPGHRKSRNLDIIGTVHLEGCVATISTIRKSPDREESIGVLFIGILEISGTSDLCILKSLNAEPR
jgi:hypothetical protein